MADVIIIEQCCYCHRNLSLDKLIHNESKHIFYCSDADDCRLAQQHNPQQTIRPTARVHRQPTGRVWSYQYRLSGCGSPFIGFVVGTVVFFGSWAYAIKTYGWFLGLGLGWVPSFFLGIMAAIFWPIAVLVLLGIVVFSR